MPAASDRGNVKSRDERGFTLIETLIALIIFSVGMLGMVKLSTVVINRNTLSQQRTTATVLAQDKLEALHSTAYGAITHEQDTMTTNLGYYVRTVKVAANVPAAGMKTVAIEMSWLLGDTPHDLALTTILRADQ